MDQLKTEMNSQEDDWYPLFLLGRRIETEIASLIKERSALPDGDLKLLEYDEQLAILRGELLETMPPERFEWKEAKPIVDLWKGKFMDENAKEHLISEKAEEIRKHVESVILPSIEVHLKARNDEKAAHEKRLALKKVYQEEISDLQEAIDNLDRKVKDLLSSGADPAEILAEIRLKKDRLECLQAWIAEQGNLSGVLPAALAEAERKLTTAVDGAVVSAMSIFQERVDELATELRVLVWAWGRARSSLYSSLEANESALRPLLIFEPVLKFAIANR